MTPIHRRSLSTLLILAASLITTACGSDTPSPAAASAQAQSSQDMSPAGLELRTLRIDAGETVHSFTVEIAKNAEEQARGLMFRTELADDAGMLFPFDPPRPASFWMKNTPIPLDIIFIRADGSIESIAANTEPYSLELIRSGETVAAVLEIAGGRAAALNIGPGDRLIDPLN